MTGTGVTVSEVTVRYPAETEPLTVLRDISVQIEAGTRVAIMGHSGAGKSTLLALIGGLEAVQDGSIRVGDHDVSRLRGDELARYRRETVGFMFQHFGLLGTLTAAENIELAMTFGTDSPCRTTRAAPASCWTPSVSPIVPRTGPPSSAAARPQRVALARPGH